MSKRKQTIVIGFMIIVLLLLSACQTKNARTINMYNADGDMTGTVKLTENPDGVKVKVKVEGVSEGYHGIHIHENPVCEGQDFKDAGSHWNPENNKHGLMHPKGSHAGDMPNVKADGDGLLKQEVTLSEATLKEGKKSLTDEEGTSVIITKDADDGMSQPSGNSGERVLCGVIEPIPTKNPDEPTDPTEPEEE